MSASETLSSPTAAPSSSRATCPNPNGGVCLGELVAGTYSTRFFQTPLSYTVPDGWGNYEDLLGNFLLVPPGGTLAGVDAGTSDYIGVYDGVAPASADCAQHPEPSVAKTPAAMAEWFAGHPGLVATDPRAVTVGGLEGSVIDLEIADGYTETPCPGLDLAVVPLIIGDGPASLHHVVVGSLTIRLFLLTAPGGETIAVEVDDLPDGETLDALTEVVESMQFGN